MLMPNSVDLVMLFCRADKANCENVEAIVREKVGLAPPLSLIHNLIAFIASCPEI